MPRPLVTGYQGFFNPGRSISIAQGAQESDAFACGGMSLTGILLPALFTGTALTFEVADAIDGYQAVAEIVLTGNPSANDTVTIKGTVVTFVTDPPVGNQVLIGADATATAAALYAFLIASVNANLILSTYALQGTVVSITAIVHGTAGNAYTLAKSGANITISGATYVGGGFRPLYDSSNALVSMTVAQGRSYVVDPANFQGVAFLKIKSGSAEAAARTLICSLKGF